MKSSTPILIFNKSLSNCISIAMPRVCVRFLIINETHVCKYHTKNWTFNVCCCYSRCSYCLVFIPFVVAATDTATFIRFDCSWRVFLVLWWLLLLLSIIFRVLQLCTWATDFTANVLNWNESIMCVHARNSNTHTHTHVLYVWCMSVIYRRAPKVNDDYINLILFLLRYF